MSIFNFYPKIAYKVNSTDYLKAIDITNSIRIRDFFKSNSGIAFRPYVIKDGERPDSVSYNVYDTVDYDWVILLVNDMYNIYDDWPKDMESFNTWIEESYDSISYATSNVKYYYDSKGNIIDYTTWQALSSSQRNDESIYQYELRKNINKNCAILQRFNLMPSVSKQINRLSVLGHYEFFALFAYRTRPCMAHCEV
jgi:hypothetical protein